jgi:UDP-N-acetylglucosamine acyltransferase
MLVEGNPAHVRSLNQVGLKRAGITTAEMGQFKKAFRTLYRSKHTMNEALEHLDLLPDNEHLQHLRRFLQLSQMEGRRGSIFARRVKREE